ncbi:hypothetical protein ACQ4PT_069798 [Festuca glaucescens]
MTEECSAEYVRCVRERYRGWWVCGLCTAAVSAEVNRSGTATEEALAAHMGVCGRFNRLGRTNPVLMQILRKWHAGIEASALFTYNICKWHAGLPKFT